ncbi:hypothetical protein ACFU99_04755 [Streptomyces sp. NPDC057654]|uniref:hypothetical protein n=1 Tax=Streptomyces sp. NPDC057654 TaxID=3346196 RepID=UPI0036C43951
MTDIDRLLARALLQEHAPVPPDTVAYHDTAYPTPFASDGTPLWDLGDDRGEQRDDDAARQLEVLCEVTLARSRPDQLADFVTEQIPAPHGAWILGCGLQLAGAGAGARSWWQYAAGAGDTAAAYCLCLHYRALGDHERADFWYGQTGLDTPADATRHRTPGYSLNLPTVLRVLSLLAPAADRERSSALYAVMEYVATTVADGYVRTPGYEIPLPGPDFAEQIDILLTAAAGAVTTSRRDPSAIALPNRPPAVGCPDGGRASGVPCGQVLVEVAAVDTDSEGPFRVAFEEAIACGEAVSRPARCRSGARLRYYLDRGPFSGRFPASGPLPC